MSTLRAIALSLIYCAASLAAGQTRLKLDEKIVFYPAIAYQTSGQRTWQAEVRGCVFEPEKRALLVAALRDALELKHVEMTPPEEQMFNTRARLFLVDHKRGRKIFIRVGSKSFAVGKSKADGTFSGRVRLSNDEMPASDIITFQAVLPADDNRVFRGQAFKLEKTGLSVISDIDDTIKMTEVRDRHAMLRNTFLREFAPVSGMAEYYQTLARSNHAQFHYVSASPWQLYEPLAAFVNTHGFPPGTFTLKTFRWKNRSFFSLFESPARYKPTVIEPLLKQFSHRHFILIGDSGERDPEIYAALARKHPQQIVRIYIRDVTGEPATSGRYVKTFHDLPNELWQVFRTPVELKPFVDAPPTER